MGHSRAAVRYATALLGVSTGDAQTDEIGRDLASIDATIRSSPQFSAFLRSPVVSKERKKKVFAELFPKLGKLVTAFIALLTAKGREALLPEIIEQFHLLRDARTGIVRARARSAVELSAAQKETLARRLGEATGKNVSVTYETDPSLVGGFTVQFGDTVLDASVSRQLEVLEDRLRH
jgi:F-type H+-transporting ATPase subunit delta